MSAFSIKQGDTLPVLEATITKADGSALDLTNATAVVFRMRNVNARPAGTFKVNAAATFVDKPNGIVRYTFTAADTNAPGSYAGEFVVSFGGDQQTVPTVGYLAVSVLDAGLPG